MKDVPIWENCKFVLCVCNKLVKHRMFDQFIEHTYSI